MYSLILSINLILVTPLDGWTKGHIPGLDPTELYYVLFDIDVLRLGLRLQTGELEDITFTIKTWMLSQNIMLVKLVEKECREREIERYIEEMLGIKKDDKPINEITKTEFSDLFGEKGKGKEPGELEKLTNEFKDAAKEMAAAKNAAGKAIGKHRLGFVKPGPYEVDFNERITKLYLIPSGRMLGTLIGLLLNNMGVG